MSHARECLYQLPDGVNQTWNGTHWVPSLETEASTAADAVAIEPWRWTWADSVIATVWRRARN